MLEITRCLTISTAHISKETEEKLKVESYQNNMCLCVYDRLDFGWWINVDDVAREVLEDPSLAEDVPEDLVACLKLAVEHDCQLLCLDCDGLVVDDLPVYER